MPQGKKGGNMPKSPLENYYRACMMREKMNILMDKLSDEAIRQFLIIKPEGGRIDIGDGRVLELALVPHYDLKRKHGWTAQIWREAKKMLAFHREQVSNEIERMRTCGEEYAEDHPDYEPEYTVVLKVIKENKEKEKDKKNK